MADPVSSIRILAGDGNEKGDLFARLMRDLFFSLGYDNPRMNIARSGREIDLEADHRFEARRAIGECKAVEATIGGREINAFAGKLRRERRRDGRTIAPYFISLSGFTEPAIDQESESGPEGVILLNGSDVRGDNLSAATHELKASSGRDLTPRCAWRIASLCAFLRIWRS
jgi:restriction endonuclease Mrr